MTVDAQGKITNREPLTRAAAGQAEFAPPPPPPGAAGGRAGGGRRRPAGGGARRRRAAVRVDVSAGAVERVQTQRLEYVRSAGRRRHLPVRRQHAAGAGGGQAVDDGTGSFGPVALYVGGTGEVRFKDLAVKDLQRRVTPAEKTSRRDFRAQHIEDFYYGWSMAAGDFNHDGVLDVTMGNRYYLGPNFTESREFYLAPGVQPGEGIHARRW